MGIWASRIKPTCYRKYTVRLEGIDKGAGLKRCFETPGTDKAVVQRHTAELAFG